jgi:hypothetical protein
VEEGLVLGVGLGGFGEEVLDAIFGLLFFGFVEEGDHGEDVVLGVECLEGGLGEEGVFYSFEVGEHGK